MTPEPQPGTSLEPRGETLPDVAVPNRAGAIVSEFVSSIVEEAQSRAGEIMAEAERDREALIQEAHEGAARLGARVQAIADELSGLTADLRRASESLHADPAVRAAMALPVPETASAELVPAGDTGEATIMDATVVDGPVGDLGEAGAGAELQPEPEAEPDEVAARLAAMSDEDLARAYSNSINLAAQQPDEADRFITLADAVVREALSRPAFTEDEPVRTGLRRRAGARKRRRRAVKLAELREACRQAPQPVETSQA